MSAGAPNAWLLSRCKTESVKSQVVWLKSSPCHSRKRKHGHSSLAMTDWPQTVSPASAARPARESMHTTVCSDNSHNAMAVLVPTPVGFVLGPRPAANPLNSQALNVQFTYETQSLMHWARSRPLARIHLATISQRRACRALRAAWTLRRMQELNRFAMMLPDRSTMLGCCGCGEFPIEATCAHCTTKWCENCYQWSASCWQCYWARGNLPDCGEVVLGQGCPGNVITAV